MTKKKVVHIVEAFGGGVFSFLVDLTSSLSEDYDFVIVFAKRKETPADFKNYFPKNTKFIESKYLQRSVKPWREFKAIREIRRIIKNEAPDVVHLHSSKAGAIGRLACPGKVNGKRIKMLYNPHGFAFLMEDTSKIKRWIYKMVERVLSVRTCTLVAVSAGEYKEARKLTKKVVQIDNGIDTVKLDLEIKDFKRPRRGGVLRICTAGRISEQKNPVLFNEIAELLPEMEFVWIGEGDLRGTLVAPNIKKTGWVERAEVLRQMNEAEVFMMTSLWEGMPIALLEAMYMGKICLVSDVIGNRDLVKEGKTGFVAKDAQEFVRRLRKINEERDLEVGRRARDEVVKKYGLKEMANKYRKVYE